MAGLKQTPSYQLTGKAEKLVLIMPIGISIVIASFLSDFMIYIILLGFFVDLIMYIYMYKTEKGAFQKALFHWQNPEILLGKTPNEKEIADLNYLKDNFNTELEKARNKLKNNRELQIVKYVDEVEVLFKKHIKNKKEIEDLNFDILYSLEEVLHQIIRLDNYEGLENQLARIEEDI